MPGVEVHHAEGQLDSLGISSKGRIQSHEDKD